MAEKNEESDDWVEKQIEAQEEYYWRLYEESVKAEAEGYSKKALEFLTETRKETVEKHYQQVAELFNQWLKINARIEILPYAYSSGIDTLSELNFHIAETAYSAINSAISGQYESANVLLREWMEVYLFAIYFDLKIEQSKNKSKELEIIKNECQDWKNGHKYIRLRSKEGPLNVLVASNNDKFISSMAKKLQLRWTEKSPYSILNDIYSDLSSAVHKGIIRREDPKRKDTILPFDYEEDLFENFYKTFTTLFEILSLILIVNKKDLINANEKHWYKTFPFNQNIIKKIMSTQKENIW